VFVDDICQSGAVTADGNRADDALDGLPRVRVAAGRTLRPLAGWHPVCYQRATAYVTDPSDRLLVFEHLDAPESGTQVPAGGIHDGEDAEDAAMRELREETGVATASLVRKLGETWYMATPGYVPAGLEQQIQHAFHFRLDDCPAEKWEWHDRSGGVAVEHRFAFRWVSLDDAVVLLWPHQAMWIDPVRRSLLHLPPDV
jgi:8-oxo-dGTP pyrophosphatase MutT (NUDIX family)